MLALATGGYRLADKGLGLDEAASAAFALHGPGASFADHNMALYYALLGGWVRVFGVSELALRAPSWLLFGAGVPLMARLARALFGESQRAAACAMLLYATNPLLVQFAQEARGYMLEVVLLMLSGWALRRTLARPSFGWAMLAGAALGLALYAHMFAAWLGLVHGAWVLWCWRARHPARWQLSAALAVSGLFAVPLLVAAADSGGGQIAWIYPPSLPAAWETLVGFGGGALAVLAELALIASYARSASAHRGWLLAWAFAPLLGSWLFSLLAQPIAHPRYLIIVMPAWLLAVAGGIEALAPRKHLPQALTACLVLASLPRLWFWYFEFEKEQWREVVAAIALQLRPDDRVALDVLGAETFDYYVVRSGQATRWPPALFPERAWAFPSPEDHLPAADVLAARLRATPRVWLVRNRSQRQWPLAQTHRLLAERVFTPRDGDDRSLFADSRGRLIELQLYTRLGD